MFLLEMHDTEAQCHIPNNLMPFCYNMHMCGGILSLLTSL